MFAHHDCSARLRCLLVIETAVIGYLARFCSKSSGVRDRRAPDYATRQLKMVAREGSAPSISGCRPDVMLLGFPSLARWMPETKLFVSRIAITTVRKMFGCLAWIRTKTVGVKTRHAACYTTRQKLVEPEVVATSPYPGKSRVPVCCGFDSLKLVLAAGLAPALATLSTSCLCIGLRERRIILSCR